MPSLSLVELEAQPLARLRDVLDDGAYEHVRDALTQTAERLSGRTVWNVNSAAEGGGVAEMLSTLMPYALGIDWDIRWAVISGDADFFEVTKGIHNALHGIPPADDDIWTQANDAYIRATEANVKELRRVVRPGDVILIHDPQAAGLIRPLSEAGAAVSWQCHIGTDEPNEWVHRAWDFLRPMVETADRYVFTRASYLWDGLDAKRLRVIPPSIDAFSPKNAPLTDEEVNSILTAAGIIEGTDGRALFRRADGTEGVVRRPVDRLGTETPLPTDARMLLEVSRWDRLKDPVGFIRMYAEQFADRGDVHAVYAGPSTDGVDDDPEGQAVLDACVEVWRSFDPKIQERVHLFEVPMEDVEENAAIVNALQRRADVVVQKSLEEGFGLTVSEAMWKARPVVASRVGGIQDQIEHERSGLLVDDPYDLEGFAEAVSALLDDPERAEQMGAEAQSRVRENFLVHRQLEQYATLMGELVEAAAA